MPRLTFAAGLWVGLAAFLGIRWLPSPLVHGEPAVPNTVRMYVFDAGVLPIADPLPLFGLKKEQVAASDICRWRVSHRASEGHVDVGGGTACRMRASARRPRDPARR